MRVQGSVFRSCVSKDLFVRRSDERLHRPVRVIRRGDGHGESNPSRRTHRSGFCDFLCCACCPVVVRNGSDHFRRPEAGTVPDAGEAALRDLRTSLTPHGQRTATFPY